MKRSFNNLHCHSNLGSMLDSLADVDELFDRAKELGQDSIAITDHGTMAAHFDAFKAYKKTGVKFIPGCELYFVNSFDFIQEEGAKKKRHERSKHLVTLAMNHNGYKNILKMNYKGFEHCVINFGRMYPRIDWKIIEEHSDDVICTSACINGPIARLITQDKYDEAIEIAQRFLDIYGDRFFIELQPHLLKDGEIDQDAVNRKLLSIAEKFGIPYIVTNDIHYLTKQSEKYHDILLALKDKKELNDPSRHRYGIDEFYVKSSDEVYVFMANHYGKDVADMAIENTIKISEMCEAPDYLEPKGNHLPIFLASESTDYADFLEWKQKVKLPIELPEDAAFMRFKCVRGFQQKFSQLSNTQIEERMKRLQNELKIIEKNRFSSYMLVVADFISWAKNNGILVGVGRGSVGGSMIAYLLGIHGVDPLKYGLLFERFQNAEKKALPDIDTDFTSAGRDLVQTYVKGKYGTDHCAHVSNINTYTPKNVIPDLVKTMRNEIPNLIPEGTNYVKVSDAIKEAIPDVDESGDKIKTLESAIALSPKLRTFAQVSPELMEYADVFIGLPKEYSTHAAGMVISDIPIVEFAPLRVDKSGNTVTQYEKERCEAIGLVKMDFLAISTLDVIDETLKNIERLGIKDGPKSMDDIPLDDKETYEMIQQGQTRCVFQLGKSTMMATLCKHIKPKNILDIAVVNALGRPSSTNERQEYIDRRFGKKKVVYLHPSLECLKETYGLCIMEEQLMGVAKDVAGWDLNKADGLRKLTKLKAKGKDLALRLEVEFIEGAIKTHSMEYELAKKIWDEVVGKFSGYGFNLSHAVFYSINGYFTAYLKRHYPAAFLAANLKVKTERGGVTKDEEITAAKIECRRLGIKIIPPDINKSSANYEILDDKTIVMGFAAIKGLGEKALDELVTKQPFHSFVDFLDRTDARIINKSKMEVLSKAGSFDSFKITRKDACENGKKTRDRMVQFIKRRLKDGYDSMMALEEFPLNLSGQKWSKPELLKYEMEVLGELVSGNLGDLFPGFFTGYNVVPLSRLKKLPDRHEVAVEILIKSVFREFKIKKTGKYYGKMMIKYFVEDMHGSENELTVWPTEYERMKKLIGDGGIPIRALCQISEFNGNKTLMLRELIEVYKPPKTP